MVVEELENRGWWIFCLCCLIRVNDLKGGIQSLGDFSCASVAEFGTLLRV